MPRISIRQLSKMVGKIPEKKFSSQDFDRLKASKGVYNSKIRSAFGALGKLKRGDPLTEDVTLSTTEAKKLIKTIGKSLEDAGEQTSSYGDKVLKETPTRLRYDVIIPGEQKEKSNQIPPEKTKEQQKINQGRAQAMRKFEDWKQEWQQKAYEERAASIPEHRVSSLNENEPAESKPAAARPSSPDIKFGGSSLNKAGQPADNDAPLDLPGAQASTSLRTLSEKTSDDARQTKDQKKDEVAPAKPEEPPDSNLFGD